MNERLTAALGAYLDSKDHYSLTPVKAKDVEMVCGGSDWPDAIEITYETPSTRWGLHELADSELIPFLTFLVEYDR